MGMTKRYPEPFQREKTKGTTYYFTVTENSGTSKKKRKNLSTGETTKERAREYIREFMDKLQATTSQQTFRDYSAEYFIWELDKKPTCPHAARLVQEGRTTGRQHSLTMRRLLERWIYTDEIFPDLK